MWGEKQQAPAYSPVSDNDEPTSSAELEDQERLLVNGHEKRQRRWPATWVIVLVATVGFLLYSAILVKATTTIMSKERVYGNRFLDTPTSDYLTYEPRVFLEREPENEPKFFPVKPNQESDHLWHEFFKGHNLKMSPEYMRSVGREQEGVLLPDGNYMAVMMVYHHMHCLKNIYHALNAEHYGLTNMTVEERDEWDDHVMHCMHMIKDGLMCQADTTLITMRWSIHGSRPTGNLSSPHECVNWDRLMEWSTPKTFDALANGVLEHPTFGAAFVDGAAQETGLVSGKHDYEKDASEHQ